ncbi:5-formyltetrahydrofolate cyclo-ligase [Flavobacteriaceae bacterium TP-CH-4]|uniref:5-formyltetrahydrofolate cyclo-ligase n=1 Tax=Pelagihabitans pacificus TaxID=2696054 RepID=A0A967ATA4_9FLAO|nr:5-formyltetrahydrofolate cyclo-ligase [Pelagihabitans pacificus]NHF58810.1 5-formyltetrahydrofolate cyclo-ligase [Pelagihabitans pacificus]
MLKKDLRLNYSALRENTSREFILNASLSIANQLLKTPIWEGSYYHIFLPIFEKKEVDTSFVLSILYGKDKQVVLPKVSGENSLTHYLLTDSTQLVKSTWGVPEPTDGITIAPSKLDVVFVPLLAFDRRGNRVGYGKGFYDRFLSECGPGVLKVGLSIFEAEDVITDVDEQDIRLDYCVTPKNIYSFKED